MAAAFRIKSFITCGFAVGELHGADEFPAGTDFVKLVADGAIRPVGELAILGGGDPKSEELMDQLEELTERLAVAEAARTDGGAKADAAVAERDKEIASLKAKLTESKLREAALENDLRAAREPKPEATEKPADGTPPHAHAKKGK